MSKAPSPLLGYNNNVRHKNRVFHIQTEDSGIKHPHIITHLFMDGGRILKSVKTSYAEQLGAEGMAETVRQMMKEQHKAMFIALRDGQFDEIVEAGVAHAAAKAAPVKAKRSSRPPPPVREKPTTLSFEKVEEPPISEGAPTTPEPVLELDIDALERAAHVEPAPAFRSGTDLPPPNPNTFKRIETGRYRTVTTAREDPDEPLAPRVESVRPPATTRSSKSPRSVAPAKGATESPAIPKPASAASVGQAPPKPGGEPAGQGRYAPARPAAIFGQARPQQGSSIFGEDLISDKSLDEVILSYLAEDLEGEKK